MLKIRDVINNKVLNNTGIGDVELGIPELVKVSKYRESSLSFEYIFNRARVIIILVFISMLVSIFLGKFDGYYAMIRMYVIPLAIFTMLASLFYAYNFVKYTELLYGETRKLWETEGMRVYIPFKNCVRLGSNKYLLFSEEDRDGVLTFFSKRKKTGDLSRLEVWKLSNKIKEELVTVEVVEEGKQGLFIPFSNEINVKLTLDRNTMELLNRESINGVR